MLKWRRVISAVMTAVIILTICGCRTYISEEEAFSEYLDEVFSENVTSDTITLHYTLAYPENYGITSKKVTLGDADISEEKINKEKNESKRAILELEKFKYDLLNEEQQLIYDLLMDSYEINLKFYDYIYFYEPFAYTSGLQTNLPISLAEYKFYDEADVKDYLELIEQVDEYIAKYLEFEEEKSKRGYFMSRNSAEEVIRQCEEYIEIPKENILIDTFNDKIDALSEIDSLKAEEYKEENEQLIYNNVISAYEDIIEVFTDLKETGLYGQGIANYPNGEEYYEYLLKSYTGTEKTAKEVIEVLDKSLDEAISKLINLAEKDYEGYIAYIEDYSNMYREIKPEDAIEFFKEAMADKFPEMPELNYTISAVHESLEGIVSPAYYMVPAIDDYKDNAIYINYGSKGASDLWSTLAHEGIYGHMYQQTYFLESEPHPIRVLLSYKGYSEGWATYVEMMSYDYYDYDNKSYAEFEKINAAINLLVSARIDIGVNYEGWDLEDTELFLTEYGFEKGGAKSIVDYVSAEPANYQMYCTGWLELEAIRKEAEVRLGDKFDEAEFHKLILDAGPCSFNILNKKLDVYIENIRKEVY